MPNDFRAQVQAWVDGSKTEMMVDHSTRELVDVTDDRLHDARRAGKAVHPDPERARFDRGFETYAPAGATPAELDAIPFPAHGTAELAGGMVDQDWNPIDPAERALSMARHPAGKAGVLAQPLTPAIPITRGLGIPR